MATPPLLTANAQSTAGGVHVCIPAVQTPILSVLCSWPFLKIEASQDIFKRIK